MRSVIMLARIAHERLHSDNLKHNRLVHAPPYFLGNNS